MKKKVLTREQRSARRKKQVFRQKLLLGICIAAVFLWIVALLLHALRKEPEHVLRYYYPDLSQSA